MSNEIAFCMQRTPRILNSVHLRRSLSSNSRYFYSSPGHYEQRASAKLFADAAKEEAENRVKSTRISVLEQQHENWDGDERIEDTVLRMLVDKYKPLRTGTVQTAEEKIKQRLPQIAPLPAHILGAASEVNAAPATPAVKVQPTATGSWATEPLLPSSAEHQPWHTTFRVPSHDEQSIKVKIASLPPPIVQKPGRTAPLDDKARRLEREKRKRTQTAMRLTDARESTLDYRFGVRGGGSEGSGASSSAHVQKNETAQVNPLSLRGWNSLIEDKIERARKAGVFDNVKGRGKPLSSVAEEYNPFIAREEFLMNRIVQRNNAAPPWVEVQSELETAVNTFRQILRQAWVRRASRMLVAENRQDQLDKLTLADIQNHRDLEWLAKEHAYHTKAIEGLNSLVRKYNGLAPYAVRRAYYTRDAEIARLFDDCADDIFRLVSERQSTKYLNASSSGEGVGGDGFSDGTGHLKKVGREGVPGFALFEWLNTFVRRLFRI